VDFNPVAGRAVNRASLFDGDRAGGALFAFGTTALLASTNGGRTWVAVRKPGPRLRIFDIDFVTPSTGYLLDSASRLYRTTNRGRRWTEIVTLGTDDAFDLAFSSRSSGWVATSALGDGTVFRTSDGGRSFSPQRIDLEGVVTADDSNGLTALGPNAGIAITGSDAAHGRAFTSLFATATGGQAGTPSALTLSAIPRRLRRAGTVRVRGRLRPAEGGETVTVARFDLRRGRWETQEARVASNGSFTTTWRLSRSAAFVANWRGDDDRAGDGSRALVVRVGRR
jgi:photosystem II stability/assembly factor-like uncharacterized protein